MKPVNRKGNPGTRAPDGLLDPEQKTQLISLLAKFRHEGVLEKKLMHFQSKEGKFELLGGAVFHKAITPEEYGRVCGRLFFSCASQASFESIHKADESKGTRRQMSQKEKDELYHHEAGECYPGLIRTKCGVYGTTKAFLILRIKTNDSAYDNSLSDVIGPNFKSELKSHQSANYYEISALCIPRGMLGQAKAELDDIARELVGRKEEKSRLADGSTSRFLTCLQNPDYRKYENNNGDYCNV